MHQSNNVRRINQGVKEKAEKYQNAANIMDRNNLTQSDCKAVIDFLKTPDHSLSERVVSLKGSIQLQLDYYDDNTARMAFPLVSTYFLS